MQPSVLRLPEVLARVPLSRASVYAFIKKGTFPAPVRLSPRAVAWREADIKAWLDARPLREVRQ